jgi:2,5-diketo-D-gluconate reductase A
MNYVTLNNGLKMPILGFGVYQMRDLAECEQSVYDAIKAGYRLIDTAAVYMNEEAVGRAIKRSGVSREELFITTKLWVQDMSYKAARPALQASLDKLQLDYVDLYLIHQPFGDVFGAWRAMEELYKEDKTKAIGVSNFASDRLTDFVMTNEITPMVNQIELHPFHQQREARAIMDEYHIQAEGWAPFAEGKQNLFKNETLAKIAKAHDKSIAQVVVRWNIQQKVIVIPKSVHKDRIEENFNVFDFELTKQDMATIATINKNERLFVLHDDPAAVKRIHERKIHD